MSNFLGPLIDTTRVCSRRVSDDPHRTCDCPAIRHIEWPGDSVAPGGAEGWACPEHWEEVQRKGWPMVDSHAVGGVCGMPGTLWSYDEHRCIEDPAGLMVAEPLRTVAVTPDRVLAAVSPSTPPKEES